MKTYETKLRHLTVLMQKMTFDRWHFTWRSDSSWRSSAWALLPPSRLGRPSQQEPRQATMRNKGMLGSWSSTSWWDDDVRLFSSKRWTSRTLELPDFYTARISRCMLVGRRNVSDKACSEAKLPLLKAASWRKNHQPARSKHFVQCQAGNDMEINNNQQQ